MTLLTRRSTRSHKSVVDSSFVVGVTLAVLSILSGCGDSSEDARVPVEEPTSAEADSYCEMAGGTPVSLTVDDDSIIFIAHTGTPDEDRTGSVPLREVRARGGFHIELDEAGQRFLIAIGPDAARGLVVGEQTIPMEACQGFALPVGVGPLPESEVVVTLTDEQGHALAGGPIRAGESGGVGLFAAAQPS